MGSGNENVYVVPGTNVFECMECGRDHCNVLIQVDCDFFAKIEAHGDRVVKATGRLCGRTQDIRLKRPSPPPGLPPHELSKIVRRLVARMKKQRKHGRRSRI